MDDKQKTSRRNFLTNMAMATVGTLSGASIVSAKPGGVRNTARKVGEFSAPALANRAPDGELLRAGLVGCGSRGTGAAVDFLDAGPNLEIVALGDVFQDQLDGCRNILKQARNVEVADKNCFVGFDSYEKVLESDIDIVLLATPPHFRPMHVKAAVEADKHIFQEKPIAVDPMGARIVYEATQKAKRKNLYMLSGTARRYQKDYAETQKQVANGLIGDVISANIIRNGGALWWVERQSGWTDMEYMLRNWGNFAWLSGDHIVEMFVHEIDVMNWYINEPPVKAIGYGGRQRRVSGDQYDFFSIEYLYDDGRRTHCAARQVEGCDNGRAQIITGTEGYADATGTIYNHQGEVIWEYPYPDENDTDSPWYVTNKYKQEHIELVKAMRTGEYLNDSEALIQSTRMAIMGRMAAYTGRDITWDEVLNSDLRLGPDSYEFGPVNGISESPPVIGDTVPPTDRYK